MRRFVSALAALFALACGQPVDHAEPAAGCDHQVMRCAVTTPPAAGNPAGNGNEGGASSGAEETGNATGSLVVFDDDYFDRGAVFTGKAALSATGKSGGRVTGSYDGTSFQLANVLKDPGNWFLSEPQPGSGALATLMPIDTRSDKALSLAVASSTAVDTIFSFLNTERAAERAQVVLTLVDENLRAVSGVTATLTAEVTGYRAATAWIGDAGRGTTDSSGMVFFGNVPAGSALSKGSISLSGAVSGRVEVTVKNGAVSVVSVIVSP